MSCNIVRGRGDYSAIKYGSKYMSVYRIFFYISSFQSLLMSTSSLITSLGVAANKEFHWFHKSSHFQRRKLPMDRFACLSACLFQLAFEQWVIKIPGLWLGGAWWQLGAPTLWDLMESVIKGLDNDTLHCLHDWSPFCRIVAIPGTPTIPRMFTIHICWSPYLEQSPSPAEKIAVIRVKCY